jgi:prepilin-type N-terminal cleavage/methylation domain-containing protein
VDHHRGHAFTLLEVLIVIALIGLLVALTLPNFYRSMETEQLSESAARFKALIAMCRAEAMNEAREYRITTRADGTLKIERQLDGVYAPNVFVPIKEHWASAPVLLERVWVEAIVDLPEGPPPFDVEDELVEFDDMVVEPVRVGQMDKPLRIRFAPDGLSDSAEWILRDADGRGLKITLDGRLGRVATVDQALVPAEQVERPERMDFDDEDLLAGTTERELLLEYMP